MSAGEPVTTAPRVVRVVPDVPSFSVDDGFAYRAPEGLAVGVGSIVRVPLGGRRVRGWVVSEGEPPRPRLREVIGVSGARPVFDERLLEVLRWAAARYVAPLAALLAKATPPNLPGEPSLVATETGGDAGPSVCWVGAGPWGAPIAAHARSMWESGKTVVVIGPTYEEATEIASTLREEAGDRVVLASSRLPAADVTAAWDAAASRPGTVLVGTREVALWPWADPGAVFVVGEGRRGMKDKATPTVHARDVVLRRSAAEGFGTVLCGLVPTGEALARAGEVVAMGRRAWGLVELVDRRKDPDGRALFSPTTAAALRAAHREGRRVLLFTDRRVGAQRCVRCGRLRRCPACGAGPGGGEACVRCGGPVGACEHCGGRTFEALGAAVPRLAAEAGRIVGREAVGEAGSSRPVVVGTERDLPGLRVDLVVVVDGDGPVLAPTYRAAEDALRLMGRAVAAAGPGRGRRAIVQTADPDHPVMRALESGDPVPMVRADARRRAEQGFPPGGEILVLEASGLPDGAGAELVEELGDRAVIHGPADARGGLRWLLQGRDLTAARIVLRGVVSRWRESGARVRVDADPVDL